MCGINGIFAYADQAPPVDQEELLNTREQMIRRGPDGAGLWISSDKRIGLAHRRLAIIDLTVTGAQPMSSADGRYQIIFNGEIYNYQKLREDLTQQGAVFRTQSDTEVLLQLFAHKGKAMCSMLRGMYTFAIWDSREQSLFLARDPFGIKPLYLHDDGKTFRFASQVKALLAGGAITSEIDPGATSDYWIWGHVAGPATMCKNIQSLEPGTWMYFVRSSLPQKATFESIEGFLRSEPCTPQEDLYETLRDSVRHHLIADVPVGIFLSSGIDSGVLTCLAALCGTNLHTVTLGFEEFRGTIKDETIYVEKLARTVGSRHETIWISRQEFADSFDAFLKDMDQPTIDGLNTWLVSRAAARLGLKAVLSGLGGDELFGGYPSFRRIPLLRRVVQPFALIPGLGRAVRSVVGPIIKRFSEDSKSSKLASLLEYGGTWAGAYLLARAIRMPWELDKSLPKSYSKLEPNLLTDHSTIILLEATNYMRDQLLRDCDWASMAHSLEIRVPFVDKVVACAVGRKANTGKPWKKSDLANLTPALPEEIRQKRKTGFNIPAFQLIKEKLADNRQGVRSWQEHVFAQFVQDPTCIISNQPWRSFALWAPALSSAGGIQSYMMRLCKTLMTITPVAGRSPSKCLALIDSQTQIAELSDCLTRNVKLHGADGKKVGFVLAALTEYAASDVIIGHLHHAPIALIAQWLGCIQSYYVVLHGIEAWRRRNFLQRLALAKAKQIIATTQYTATTCATLNDLSSSNFKIVPLCADPFSVEPDRSFLLDGEWPILFVGRLMRTERYKGLDTVIHAVAALRARHIPVKLHVIGDGDDNLFYSEIGRDLGLDDAHLQFHGMVSSSKLEAAYCQTKVFVMPSAKEGFGIVFLEAMRHGVPCIGGAHGGTPEVFDDGKEGELIHFGDVEALTEKLARMYNNPEHAAAMGAAARQRCSTDYSYKIFFDRWASVMSQ